MVNKRLIPENCYYMLLQDLVGVAVKSPVIDFAPRPPQKINKSVRLQISWFIGIIIIIKYKPLEYLEAGECTLQETNISHQKSLLKMIFLFPRWDMLIPWRVLLTTLHPFLCILNFENFAPRFPSTFIVPFLAEPCAVIFLFSRIFMCLTKNPKEMVWMRKDCVTKY